MNDIAVAGKPLTAVFDLSLCNPNFEFFTFLVLAEIERKARGCDYVHLVFVPGGEARFYRITSYDDDGENWWRFQNILLLGAGLLPSCRQITSLNRREEARPYIEAAEALYPGEYGLDRPIAGYCMNDLIKCWLFETPIPSLKAPDHVASRVRRWLLLNAGGRIPITVTLRQDSENGARNNRISEWLTFLRGLDRNRYFPIVIPDTAAIFRDTTAKIAEFDVYPEFSVHILMRAALYECAYLNLFSANGPAGLCYLTRGTRFIQFNTAVKEDSQGDIEEYEIRFGVPVGDQPPFCEWHQRFVFEPDDAVVIGREFDGFMRVAQGQCSPEQYRPVKSYAPEDVARRLQRGRAFAQARDIYARLLQDDPSRIDIRLALAHLCLDLRDYAAAQELAKRLEEILPDGIEINFLLAELYLATDRFEAAHRCWTKLEDIARRTSDDYPSVFVRFIWAMERLGKISELTQRFRESVDRIGSSHMVCRAMGEALAKRGLGEIAQNFFKAELQLLERVIESETGAPNLKIRCAELHSEIGDPGRAMEILEPLLSSKVSAHDILSGHALALEKIGRDSSAVEFHRKAVELSGKVDGIAVLRLAKLLHRLGELDESLQWAEHCNRIAPSEPRVLVFLIELLQASGQMSKALRYAAELQTLSNSAKPIE